VWEPAGETGVLARRRPHAPEALDSCSVPVGAGVGLMRTDDRVPGSTGRADVSEAVWRRSTRRPRHSRRGGGSMPGHPAAHECEVCLGGRRLVH
jgi:hypothetical protein